MAGLKDRSFSGRCSGRSSVMTRIASSASPQAAATRARPVITTSVTVTSFSSMSSFISLALSRIARPDGFPVPPGKHQGGDRLK